MNKAFLVNSVVASVFLVFGTAAAAGTFFLFRRSYRKIKNWERTLGTITGYAEHLTARQGIFFRPQIQFTDTNGKEIAFTSSIGSRRKSYRIGASINVLYPPASPADADIRSFATLWLPSLFPFFFVVGFWGTSLYLFLLNWYHHALI
jgi:hypothetical protein